LDALADEQPQPAAVQFECPIPRDDVEIERRVIVRDECQAALSGGLVEDRIQVVGEVLSPLPSGLRH
jgi:hypothetical protein